VMYITTIALAFVAAGCTSIPSRFNTADHIYDDCGYAVDGESSEGFSLEVMYKEYKFFPASDPVVLAARECFVKTATELARRKGKSIAPLGTADMSATANRNTVDARYLVNVVGKVRYGQK
jgi:hypothetical protein